MKSLELITIILTAFSIGFLSGSFITILRKGLIDGLTILPLLVSAMLILVLTLNNDDE